MGCSLLPPGRLHTRTHLTDSIAPHSPPDPIPVSQVCTTELGEVARRAPDFAARGVKLIGLSANGLDSHEAWINDINKVGAEIGPTDVQFPIVRPNYNPFFSQPYLCPFDRSPIPIVASLPPTTCWMPLIPPTSMRRASPSLSGERNLYHALNLYLIFTLLSEPSLSSTPRKSSASPSPTLLRPAVRLTRSSE